MTTDQLRSLCLSHPGVTESIKWENHLVFSVGEKMFLIVNPDEYPVNASFKTSGEKFDELTGREGLKPAPYLAKHKWVQCDTIDRFPARQWKELVALAYRLVFEKLSKKVQASIR